jgi:peptidoglycan/LPS O-acetylase OafA/YrhL
MGTTSSNSRDQRTQAIGGNATLPGLHGLRAIAALMIVCFHLAPNVRVPDALSIIKSHFGLGVPLFFVLSGFSLMYSTSRYVGRDGWVQVYLIKRFFRIAPLFYVMIAFFTVYNIFVWNLEPTPAPIVINMLFLQNLVPGYHESIVWAGWTLGVEMLFYAMFPILLVTITGLRRGAVIFGLSVLASMAARELLQLKDQSAYASMSFVVNAPYFFAGILAFHIYQKLSAYQLQRVYVGPLCSLVFAVALWVIMFTPIGGALVGLHRLDLVAWACLFGFACIWQALCPSRTLALGPLQYCGERSYSIYLVHAVTVFRLTPFYLIIYGTIGHDTPAFLLSLVVGIIAALSVASITYRLVEVPGIQLGAALISRSRRAAVRAAPATVQVAVA